MLNTGQPQPTGGLNALLQTWAVEWYEHGENCVKHTRCGLFSAHLWWRSSHACPHTRRNPSSSRPEYNSPPKSGIIIFSSYFHDLISFSTLSLKFNIFWHVICVFFLFYLLLVGEKNSRNVSWIELSFFFSLIDSWSNFQRWIISWKWKQHLTSEIYMFKSCKDTHKVFKSYSTDEFVWELILIYVCVSLGTSPLAECEYKQPRHRKYCWCLILAPIVCTFEEHICV